MALISQAGDAAEIFPPDWLWGLPNPIDQQPPATGRQIWVVRPGRPGGTLVEETKGYLSAPAWSPVGDSLVFLCVEPDGEQASDAPVLSGRIELARRYRDGKREVIMTRSGDWPADWARQLPHRETAWSPDGRWVAFPWFEDAPKLAVIEIATGTIVATRSDADAPSWSPTGNWLAYAQKEPAAYRVIHAGDWEREFDEIPTISAMEPAVWDWTGDGIFVIRTMEEQRLRIPRADLFNRRGRRQQLAVTRVQIPGFSSRVVAEVDRPAERVNEFLASSLSYRGQDDTLAAISMAEGSSSSLSLSTLLTPSIPPVVKALDRFRVNGRMPMGGLDFSPDGRWLAFHFGVSDWSAPAAVYDFEQDRIIPFAPSQAMRMRAVWSVAILAERDARQLAAGTPLLFGIGQDMSDPHSYRTLPTKRTYSLDLFDLPGRQQNRDPEVQGRLDALSELGLELLAPLLPTPPDEIARPALEAELLFHYLAEDYAGAIRAIDRLRPALKDAGPDLDQAILIVRLQCLVGLGKRSEADWELTRIQRSFPDQPNQAPADSDPPVDEARRNFREAMSERMAQLARLVRPMEDDAKESDAPQNE